MTSNNILQPLPEILEDLSDWATRVLKAVFYRDHSLTDAIDLPTSFLSWLQINEQQNKINENVLIAINSGKVTLQKLTREMFDSHGLPQMQVFEDFMRAYEHLQKKMLSLEVDSLMAGHGFDTLTGFKNTVFLYQDLTRELERRARRGNPFSIVMIRIDGNPQGEELLKKIQVTAKALRQAIRGFDDIYKLNDLDFLVSLKHSDMKGALKFIERMRNSLEEIQAGFTLSYCSAEPEPGDDLVSFLKNVEQDLNAVEKRGGNEVAYYEDISPLQRFVSDNKGSNK